MSTLAVEIGWGWLLALKAVVILAIVPAGALLLGYTFLLKMMSHMQSRLGPMDPGGFHGWFQLIGDGMKFLQKEDIIPDQADRRVFALAPTVVVISRASPPCLSIQKLKRAGADIVPDASCSATRPSAERTIPRTRANRSARREAAPSAVPGWSMELVAAVMRMPSPGPGPPSPALGRGAGRSCGRGRAPRRT